MRNVSQQSEAAANLHGSAELLEWAEEYHGYCQISSPTLGDSIGFRECILYLCDRPALGAMFLEAAKRNHDKCCGEMVAVLSGVATPTPKQGE